MWVWFFEKLSDNANPVYDMKSWTGFFLSTATNFSSFVNVWMHESMRTIDPYFRLLKRVSGRDPKDKVDYIRTVGSFGLTK